jgi:hypothetical protein
MKRFLLRVAICLGALGAMFVSPAEAYYGSHLGRFITRDPIGYRGGTNTYRYVDNQPIDGVDPNGLIRPIITGGFLFDSPIMGWFFPTYPPVTVTLPDGTTVTGEPGRPIKLPNGENLLIVDAPPNDYMMGQGLAMLPFIKCPSRPPGNLVIGNPGPGNYPKPPGWNPNWTWGPPSGDAPLPWRWWDDLGGEWHYHGPDPWHSTPHWDHNPWTDWNSPWENVH